VEGETEYAFKHLLVRDVAYGQIPRAERSKKHVETAAWIESFGRLDDHAEMLAHHYAAGLELARASSEDVGDFEPRARRAFRDAGDRAATLHALPAAERYYADALALAPDDPNLLFRHGQIRWLRSEEGAEEIEMARDAFLANGDRELAAEAALALAQAEWRAGRRDRMEKHMENARALVADLPPSRLQADVLCEASRYEMVADRSDTAVELGREALRVAETLGLDDIRAKALINVGTARAGLDQEAGLGDIENGIEIASRINLITEVLRGMNNIEVRLVLAGDLTSGRRYAKEVIEFGQRYGHLGFVRFVEYGAGITHAYTSGEWDVLVEDADAMIRMVEEGSAHYNAANPYNRRAMVRLARGDDAGALHDAERALELARPAGDAQVVVPVLAEVAQVHLGTGDHAQALALFDEALDRVRELPRLGFAVYPFHTLAWLARSFGREAEIEALLSKERAISRWIPVSQAVLADDFHHAADLLAEIGAPAWEAFYRLQSGREDDVRAALDFYRGVGATRYVREGEALLAASA
jgi:tetratricopeptide (TPR) repeat protein